LSTGGELDPRPRAHRIATGVAAERTAGGLIAVVPAAGGHYCHEYEFLRTMHATTYSFRALFPGAAARHIRSVANNEVRVLVDPAIRRRPWTSRLLERKRALANCAPSY
jgi:hypothetical protein